MFRYYSKERPVSIGTFPKPKNNKVLGIFNFDEPTYVAEISENAWGYIDYEKPLSGEDRDAYELLGWLSNFAYWVTEECPECSHEVHIRWVLDDGMAIYCPHCGYRMKLCSMCDYRNSECNWDSETGKCRQDREEIWKHFQ